MDGWEVRRHRHALIRFEGRTWRVARKTVILTGAIRYELVPWSPAELELTGPEIDYGPDFVAQRDRANLTERRRGRSARLLRCISPLIGFLGARTKGRLEAVYRIDPVAATWHSLYVEYFVVLASLALTTIGMISGGFPWVPFLPFAALAAVDSLVRWDRIIGEERPPPGFYEWLLTGATGPSRRQ